MPGIRWRRCVGAGGAMPDGNSRTALTRAGAWATPLMLAVIDDHPRLIRHLQWYLD